MKDENKQEGEDETNHGISTQPLRASVGVWSDFDVKMCLCALYNCAGIIKDDYYYICCPR